MPTSKLSTFLIATFLSFTQIAYACTGFGAVTESGTIIGKNRDYFYVPQKFGLVMPASQLQNWFGNSYHHHNQFYALTSAESVSMGVNQNGLTAIEEDVINLQPETKDAQEYKALQQQVGIPDGMILYGVLQNFNSVEEMLPYLSKIFSAAAPDFYQFADAKELLTVEVGHGKDRGGKNPFTYQIIAKKNEYFTHTNVYLSPKFISYNDLISNINSFNSANNRLKRINYLISHSSEKNLNDAISWTMDTYSNVSTNNDPNQCLNTSLFRTNLKGLQSIDMNMPNDRVFGTVATMIVSNQGDFKNSHIYVMMLDSVTTQNNGHQLIKYRVLNTTLEKLFSEANPIFIGQEFMRNSPINGVCS